MTREELQSIIDSEPYDFLRTNPHLGKHLMFLTIGGSHAYGTNVKGSDVDIRGVALNSKEDLIGLGERSCYRTGIQMYWSCLEIVMTSLSVITRQVGCLWKIKNCFCQRMLLNHLPDS